MSVSVDIGYDICAFCGDIVMFKGNVNVSIDHNQVDSFCCDNCRHWSIYVDGAYGPELISDVEYEQRYGNV